MIHGHKASGYFVSADAECRPIVGETRQCVHCQYLWEYAPGSGVRRGWCLKHNGFICARPECFKEQERMIANYFQATGKVFSCLAWEEWVDFLDEQSGKVLEKLSPAEFIVSPSGLIVPKDTCAQTAAWTEQEHIHDP